MVQLNSHSKVTEPPHEHAFTIQTENNPYTQQLITLRICSTCGLTHTLRKDEFAHRLYWMFVEEEQGWHCQDDAIQGLSKREKE